MKPCAVRLFVDVVLVTVTFASSECPIVSYTRYVKLSVDCVPAKGSGCLISLEDIIAAEHDDCGLPELYQGGLCYMGRDVARRRDGQIQIVQELLGDVLWERDGYREVGQSFAHQDAWFDARFADRRLVQARIDQTGMGEKVVEDAQRRHGASRVVGVLLTGPNRIDLAFGLQRRFQTRKIRIRKDPRTRADLMAIKKIGSEQSGGVRIVNEGTVHADEFWAYSLGSQACDLAGSLYEYRGIAQGGNWRDGLHGLSHESIFAQMHGTDSLRARPGRQCPPRGRRFKARAAFRPELGTS